jgi:hypothetical protein
VLRRIEHSAHAPLARAGPPGAQHITHNGDSKNFLGLLGTDRHLRPTNGQVVVGFALMNTWVYRAVGTALLILAAVELGNLIRFFASSHPKPLEGHSVATEWNESVHRLGIAPIYPPQEDLLVGDIFAVITRSDNEYLSTVLFDDHAIKLWHVDMTAALKAAYNAAPVFPRTKERPLHEDDSIWEPNESENLFQPGGKKTLSLVAFPDLSIHHSRSATAEASTGSGIWSWFSGMFGITRNDEEREQLSFPAAETYGVNSFTRSVHFFLSATTNAQSYSVRIPPCATCCQWSSATRSGVLGSIQ